jgi:hypothetical protein
MKNNTSAVGGNIADAKKEVDSTAEVRIGFNELLSIQKFSL